MDFRDYLAAHADWMNRLHVLRTQWLRGSTMNAVHVELDEDIALAHQAGRIDATHALLVHLVRRFPADRRVSEGNLTPGVSINGPANPSDPSTPDDPVAGKDARSG